MKDNVSSVIGDKRDLICTKCKKERTARLSGHCFSCTVKLEPHFLSKFSYFKREKYNKIYPCFACRKTFTEKTGWRTKCSRVYLCEDCYKKGGEKNGNISL